MKYCLNEAEKLKRVRQIKRLRKKNLSDQEIANELGIHKTTVCRFIKEFAPEIKRYSPRLKIRDPVLKKQRRMFCRLKAQCRKRGVQFNLEFSEIHFPERCPVLGTRLVYRGSRRIKEEAATPSFDRLNPRKGYVTGNVAVISMRANRLKSDATLKEVKSVYAYMKKFRNGTSGSAD